jgi:hypothetical protein
MLQYVCDNCGTVKAQGESWILGFAAERLGARAARREVTIAPAWDENRAVQWFAVHFCSVECKDTYLERLFGEAPEGVTDVVTSKVVSKKKAQTAPVVVPVKRVTKRVVAKRRVS